MSFTKFKSVLAIFFSLTCLFSVTFGTFSVLAVDLLDDSNDSGSFSNPTTGGNVPTPTTGGNIPSTGFITNPLGNKANTAYQLVELIIKDIVIPLGMVLIVLMIIFAGFQFVMAQGNPTKLEDAKKTFFNAIIGASIILGAWAIATIIETTVNQITGR